MSEDRLDVRKTYKLLINGAFPRSESGRSYEVTTTKGEFVANVAQGSRKDVRDAVVAARRTGRARATLRRTFAEKGAGLRVESDRPGGLVRGLDGQDLSLIHI